MAGTLVAQFMALVRSAPLSQGEIARRTDLTPGAISKYLSGKSQPSVESIEKIVAACDGVIRITTAGSSTDSLAGLTPEERGVVEAMRRAQLGGDDAARVAGITHALGTASGLARDMLEGQVDALVAATRKSSGSDVNEQRRAG